ncbi:hypothetical protein HELRODRAFT_162084 [Helobdella robusta]|uniref:Uncharacterized protein n=1 Tax=Helobdella robusta TaxID=6412 RepID=T1ES84_HELRO|nr:hypothetical protein HELRODRAFT_162084 [Helobdella robusta]ESN98646.1 hypothetical protein HELRODRAFT_162084 [Helobdella robusta]
MSNKNKNLHLNISVVNKAPGVKIDFRENSFVHVYTVNDGDGEAMTRNAPAKDHIVVNLQHKNNKEKKLTKDTNEIESDDSPSTIIHLKISPETELSCDGFTNVNDSSSDEKVHKRDKGKRSPIKPATIKNCSKFRKVLREMKKEGQSYDKKEDNKTKILKEFEINNQLEKLRTETLKVPKKRGHTFYGNSSEKSSLNNNSHTTNKFASNNNTTNSSSAVKLVMPPSPSRSLVSDISSSNDISSIFTDPEDSLTEVVSASSQGDHTINEAHDPNNMNSIGKTLNLLGPASFKRKYYCCIGPQSKRKKLLTQLGIEDLDDNKISLQHKRLLSIMSNSHQQYNEGMRVFKDTNGVQIMEAVNVYVPIKKGCCKTNRNKNHSYDNNNNDDDDGDDNCDIGDENDDEDDYSLIGSEVLKLWNLTDSEIEELKKQVREEQRHKEEEHIMPLIMNLTYDQIESTYSDVKYDVTNDDGRKRREGKMTHHQESHPATQREDDVDDGNKCDDHLEDDDEEEDEDDDDEDDDDDDSGNIKSLDALYDEEFNKNSYKRFLTDIEKGPSERWKLIIDENVGCVNGEVDRPRDGALEPTEYSRRRPKRSCVDYTPSAYAAIDRMMMMKRRKILADNDVCEIGYDGDNNNDDKNNAVTPQLPSLSENDHGHDDGDNEEVENDNDDNNDNNNNNNNVSNEAANNVDNDNSDDIDVESNYCKNDCDDDRER